MKYTQTVYAKREARASWAYAADHGSAGAGYLRIHGVCLEVRLNAHITDSEACLRKDAEAVVQSAALLLQTVV